MTGRYKAYPEYKYSGVEWFNSIPRSWSVSRLKFCSSINMGQSPNSDDCNTDGKGLAFLQGNAEFGDKHPSEKQFCPVSKKIAKAGELLFSVRAPVGALNVADKDYGIGRGLCSIKNNLNVKQSFLWWVLPAYKTQFDAVSTGSTFEAVSAEQVGNLTFGLPSKTEQQKIANFLDHETAKIDTLIAKQKKLIELLKEKRQAVISHAVTKGLNPDAPMKDSGVEWLGEVPEHWEVTRAKFVSNIFVPQRNKPELNSNNIGTSWATMDDMKSDFISSTQHSVSEEAFKSAGSKVLPKNSVIASCVGNFGVASINKIDVVINQQLQAYIPTSISPLYLRELVSISKCYFELVGTAATLVYVNQQGFENLPITLPSIEEQQSITDYLTVQKRKFDKLIDKCFNQVELFRERKTALISAAVTGKIDVRDWQPQGVQ